MKSQKIIFFTLIFIINSTFFSLYSENFISEFSLVNKDSFSYRAPTERQIEYETSAKIKSTLASTGTPIHYFDFWTKIIANEEKGFFGYQAAKQGYRIFQDIIKMVFEEVLGFEIKKDFYFLRIPLDPSLFELSSAQNFLQLYPHVNDGIPEQRNQIISMNYTLFGNFSDFSQCTVCYFAQNHSWFKINYEEKLQFLFKELGLPTQAISSLFKIGQEIDDYDTGVIFQFFDDSHYNPIDHNPYELVDCFCYPAIGAGPYDGQVILPLSQIFQSTFAKKFDKGTGQLRLIMNTATTLNPYSELSIRRYDLVDSKLIEKYEVALREKIQSLSRDPILVGLYKNKLKAIWYVD